MAEKSKIRVLMTGAGAPGAPGIIKCLNQSDKIELFCCDADPNALGRHLNGNFFTVPRGDHEDFVGELLGICKDNEIDIILPLVTRELFPLSQSKGFLEANGTKVLVSDHGPLSIANDKGKLYDYLFHDGIDVPDFRITDQLGEMIDFFSDLGYPHVPVCFKPCVSNGSRGFRILSPTVDEFDLLFNYKPNNLYISPSKVREILSGHELPRIIVSEYLPGDEYSVDCLAKNGETIFCLPRKRNKMTNGISVEGEFIENPAIIEYCIDIIGALHLHGNIGIQVKQARDGKFKILEINPRVQGTIVSTLGAGINLPLSAVLMEMGHELKLNDINIKWGTKFSRYWEEVFY